MPRFFEGRNSPTIKYTGDDVIRAERGKGYAVHLENICLAPEPLTLFTRLFVG